MQVARSYSVNMFAEQMANDTCLKLPWYENIFDEGWVYSNIKYHGHFTKISESRFQEVYQNFITMFISAARCDTRVYEQPPNSPPQ